MALRQVAKLRSILVATDIRGSHGVTTAAVLLDHLFALPNKLISSSRGCCVAFEHFLCIHNLTQRRVEQKSMFKIGDGIFLSVFGPIDITAIGVINGYQRIKLDGLAIVFLTPRQRD